MTVTIVCVGRMGERHWTGAAAEYAKRLSAFCKLSVVEVDEHRLPAKPSDGDVAKALEAEGRGILAKIPAKAMAIALCIEGREMPSEELARVLDRAAGRTSQVAFIIGGSHGLSRAVKERADLTLSLSPMTFPHQLARIMVLEQVYRAFSINHGMPYHK